MASGDDSSDSGDDGTTTFSQDQQYFSISTPLDSGSTSTFVLTDFEGEEGISMLFLYRLRMFSTDDTVSFDSLVGKNVTITITFAQATGTRYINGIISKFELSHYDPDEGIAYYEAELRPWLWLLTLTGDCKIYQDQAVPDIVTAVCTNAGYNYVTSKTTKTYAQREYCVQYDESDYNFIARLLEREGIYYFFSHSNGEHDLILGDDASAFSACSTVSTLDYRPSIGYDTEDSHLTTISYENSVAAQTFGVNSFNFETPSTSLYSTAQGSAGTGTRATYNGDFINSTDGETFATNVQLAATAPTALLRGTGRARSLVAGYTFTLSDHPRTALNQTYVLLRVRVSGSRQDYRAHFEAFPSSITYRPPMITPLPHIYSTQTAIVVGKQGEEIWVDSYGRIKVQFHWDRVGTNDEKSSCWIRVAQSWAGKSYGNVFTPRIGQEVVVTFLDGNPDYPLVTGAVYNADQTIPFDMTKEATKSGIKTLSTKQGTGLFNQLRFEDLKGSEEIFIQAQKDMNVTVINNYTTTVTGNYTLNVNQATDQNGNKTGGQRAITVSAAETNNNLDTYTHTFAKTRALTVTGAETHNNADAFTHSVSKDYTLNITGNLTITVTGDVTLKGKSLTFEATSTAVSIKSGTTTGLNAGTELDLQSGTAMQVKSGTDMTLNSGMGLNLKSTMALQAQGMSVSVKGDTTGEVSAGASLSLKGAMTQIN